MRGKILLSSLIILFAFLFNFEEKAGAELRYKDISESSALYKELTYLDERGILGGGYVTPFYAPESAAERRQAITMISLALGLDETKRETIFSDISKDHHASGLIQSAVDKGIVTGYGDGTFKPYNPLTRAHLALFIDRAFGEYLPNSSDIEFKDVPKSFNAYKSIKKLAQAGITTGYGDSTFRPNETLTRAHLATFMYRTVQYLENKGFNFKDIANNDIDLIEGENSGDNYQDSSIKLGLSYDSVYKKVKKNIIKSTPKAMIVTNRARYGLPGKTTYLFNDNLTYLYHEFDWSKEKNLPDKVSLLHKMYEDKVIEEFGKAYTTTTTNNSMYLKYFSAWDNGAFKIMLETTKDDEGVTVQLTIFDGK